MTTLREAAQQALEALEWHYHQGHSNTLGGLRLKIDEKALRNLRAALAQEQAETQRTPAWWRDGLTATLMREGVNKHRAREIADGYWQAYCEVGGNDD